MQKQWIFQSFIKDFFALWGLAFPLIAILMVAPEGRAWAPLALVAYIFIDSGHAYATVFRTFLNKKFTGQYPIMLWTPLFCFFILFTWAWLGFPYLWSFVLYATFFHNTRQHYGILKWYEKINKFVKGNQIFLYGLTVLPFITFHFRNLEYRGIYHKNELFLFPNETLHLLFLGANVLLILGFFIFSYLKFRASSMTTPVFFSVLFPALVNFCCFQLGNTIDQVLVPLVTIHGVGYFFLTSLVVEKNSNTKLFVKKWIFVIVGLSILLGFLEYLAQVNFVKSSPSMVYQGNILQALAVSLVLVPLMTHYVLDGLIWKKSDPEFSRYFDQLHSKQM